MANDTETRKATVRNHSFAACKACGTRHGHTLVEEVTRTTVYYLGMMKSHKSVRTLENPIRAEKCCGARLKWVTVRAKKTEHECDSRCRNAKGGDCDCSCGGVNHGRGG
jgi:hypothetical protein